jgi:hypothetical protein
VTGLVCPHTCTAAHHIPAPSHPGMDRCNPLPFKTRQRAPLAPLAAFRSSNVPAHRRGVGELPRTGAAGRPLRSFAVVQAGRAELTRSTSLPVMACA